MTTGTYGRGEGVIGYRRPLYSEREMLMEDRFFPGEFGWVIVLGIASLLVFSLAMWGLVT